MPRLIALVGLPGAGKSTVTEIFTDQGYQRVYFGGLTIDKLTESGQAINEVNERKMREELRSTYGMGAYALLNLPKVETALTKGKTIIDDLYSWEEYLLIKEKFPYVKILAVYAPPAVRYQRLAKRKVRPLTTEEAASRDQAQIENLHQAGPIAVADWTFLNLGTKDELVKMVKIYIDGQS